MDADTIVAYEMDGRPIPPLHGAPLRVIVPGWEGAYSVKWLQRLTVAAKEHDGFWVASAYRYPKSRVMPGATVAAGDQAPLMGLAVKSLITRPFEAAVVVPGPVEIAGFAWAGESRITRVDVSIDGGASWNWPARLTGPVHKYAWRRFSTGPCCASPASSPSSRARRPIAARRSRFRAALEPGWLSVECPGPNRCHRGRRPLRRLSTPAPTSDTASHPTFDCACRACHDDDLTAQQRLTREGWGREVGQDGSLGRPCPARGAQLAGRVSGLPLGRSMRRGSWL